MRTWLLIARRYGVFAVVLALLATPALAQQPEEFDNGDFKGPYSLSLTPFYPSGNAQYWIWVGSFYADGEGNITGGVRLMQRVSGSIWQDPVEQSFSGTYTVNANGTGVAAITVQTPPLPSVSGVGPDVDWNEFYFRPEESFTFVLSEGGRHLQIVHKLTQALLRGVLTEPMVDHVRGEARRQDSPCLKAFGRVWP